MIKAEKIKKSFGGRAVLDGVDVFIDGTRAALMGESGTGKTTLLRILSGLDKADSGVVKSKGNTAVIFAEPRLFPGFCAMENITCVMHGDKKQNEERAREILSALGIGDAGGLMPRELSSGMAVRVSIARAIAFDADNYLLDEPFRALDDESRRNVISYLDKCFIGKSVFMITHNEADADMLCGEKYLLYNGKTKKNC